jgi:hypothetical protein
LRASYISCVMSGMLIGLDDIRCPLCGVAVVDTSQTLVVALRITVDDPEKVTLTDSHLSLSDREHHHVDAAIFELHSGLSRAECCYVCNWWGVINSSVINCTGITSNRIQK